MKQALAQRTLGSRDRERRATCAGLSTLVGKADMGIDK
jgi:hypothetical protein